MDTAYFSRSQWGGFIEYSEASIKNANFIGMDFPLKDVQIHEKRLFLWMNIPVVDVGICVVNANTHAPP